MPDKKCILIFSRYPKANDKIEGYFSRVLKVDRLLRNFRLIYVERVQRSERFLPKLEIVDLDVLRLEIQTSHPLHLGYFIYLILRYRRIYCHSLFNASTLLNWVFKIPGIKSIWDVHGAVPEELKMEGETDRAKYYEILEARLLRSAEKIIVVSEAMQQHLLKKHQALKFAHKFILLPILPDLPEEKTKVSGYNPNFPRFIYAGGTQVWQNIDRMSDFILRTCNQAQFQIFVPDTKTLPIALLQEASQNPRLKITSTTHREVLEAYRLSDFGFLLRDDEIVNRVACPTKLIEYLAYGVVPVVLSAEIGDFKKFGYMTIPFDKNDFSIYLPEPKSLELAIEKNKKIVNSLREIALQAEGELCQFFQ